MRRPVRFFPFGPHFRHTPIDRLVGLGGVFGMHVPALIAPSRGSLGFGQGPGVTQDHDPLQVANGARHAAAPHRAVDDRGSFAGPAGDGRLVGLLYGTYITNTRSGRAG